MLWCLTLMLAVNCMAICFRSSKTTQIISSIYTGTLLIVPQNFLFTFSLYKQEHDPKRKILAIKKNKHVYLIEPDRRNFFQ